MKQNKAGKLSDKKAAEKSVEDGPHHQHHHQRQKGELQVLNRQQNRGIS
jgi:hypothetical protein